MDIEVLETLKMTRRRLFMAVSLGSGGLAAAIAGVPIIGFFLGPMMRKYPPVWRDVGAIESFEMGATVKIVLVTSAGLPWDGATQRVAAWLRRDNAESFTVYSARCTHLGCPVRWIPGAELFMCPCHGGVYYKNGDVAVGPPPQALQQFPVRVANGRVQVQWRVERVHYSAELRNPCDDCPGCAPANTQENTQEKEV